MTVVALDTARLPAGYVLRDFAPEHVTAFLRGQGRTLRVACTQGDCAWGTWALSRVEAARFARQHDRRKHAEAPKEGVDE